MKVLERVTFDRVRAHFDREHPHDPADDGNTNDEAAGHLRSAQRTLGGRWHRVLLHGPEVLEVVLPWHLGEYGTVELIPPTGLTLERAAARLAALGDSYGETNPVCAAKLAHHRRSTAPAQPLFLSTRAVPGEDYAALTVRQGLIHLDGLHRMLAWRHSGRLAPGRWVEAYVAGLNGD